MASNSRPARTARSPSRSVRRCSAPGNRSGPVRPRCSSVTSCPRRQRGLHHVPSDEPGTAHHQDPHARHPTRAPARPGGRPCGRLLDGGKVADHAERVSHDELGCVSSNTQPRLRRQASGSMSELPSRARCVVIGAGHRRQQPRVPPGPAGLAGHRAPRQGPAAEPRRLHRARVQLHLPGRPLPRDDRPDPGQRAAVQGARGLHRVRRHRGRTHRGAHAGAAPADRLVARPGASSPSWSTPTRVARARAVPGPVRHHRRLPHARASASSTRCAPARSCASGPRRWARSPCTPASRSSAWTSRAAASAGCAPTAATSRPRRSSSPAACGARSWPGWPARASRSPRRCTR